MQKVLGWILWVSAGLVFGFGTAMAGSPDGPCVNNPMTFPYLSYVITPGGVVLNNLDYLDPLGNISGSNHTLPTAHAYLYLTREVPGNYSTPSLPTKLFAPGDIKVVAVNRHVDNQPTGPVTAYQVTFRVCQDTYFYVDHLNTLDPAITAVTGSPELIGGASCDVNTHMCTWVNLAGIQLAAGSVLGTTQSTHAIDIGAFDINYLAPYITPTFYSPDYLTLSTMFPLTVAQLQVAVPSKAYKKCPLDYFDSFSSSALLAYNRRTATPICGDFAQDIPGRATGAWLPWVWNGALPRLFGVDAEENQAIALTHDSIDPTIPAFSLGVKIPVVNNANETSLTGSMSGDDLYFDVATDSVSFSNGLNWAFSDIAAGSGVYCYWGLRTTPSPLGATIVNRVLLVQMRTELVSGVMRTILRVQAREGTTCPPLTNRNLYDSVTALFFRD